MINIESENVFTNCLKTDEKLLWSGKPKVEYLMKVSEITKNLLVYIISGICMIIINLFEKQAQPSSSMFTVIFIIWILWLIFNYFIIEPKSLKNTIYGLTNQRIMVILHFKKEKIEDLRLEEITKI